MATLAEVRVPAAGFALHETLQRLEGVEFEVLRVAAHGNRELTPFVWVNGVDRDALEAAFEADPSVVDHEVTATFDDELLFRMRWRDGVDLLEHVLFETDATILQAVGDGEEWRLRLLVPDRDALSDIDQFADASEDSIDVLRFYELDDDRARGPSGLTAEQRAAVEAAHEAGYYDFPREADLEDLAEEFDITPQAVSDRLRRAHRNLVRETVLVGDAPGAEL